VLSFPGYPRQADAGVVAQQVYATEALEGGIGERGDLILAADVGRPREDAIGGDAEAGGGGFELGALDVGQHQIHALGGGAARQFEANAAGGPRNDGGAVAKVLHALLLVLRAVWRVAVRRGDEGRRPIIR
jgi:hypothetical protein